MHEAYQKLLQLVRDPVNVYVYGSRAYECHKADADFDFIVVAKNLSLADPIEYQNINATVYSIADFKKKIDEHEISVIECLFLPRDKVLKEDIKFEFKLDIKQLRKSLSAKSSNSWVKAKKKFDVENEFYIARKSLFHSIRILLFGKQLAEQGKLTDFTVANKHWTDIMNSPETEWKSYKKTYQPIYNEIKSAFKKAAPK